MTSSTHGGCVQIPTLAVVDDTFATGPRWQPWSHGQPNCRAP